MGDFLFLRGWNEQLLVHNLRLAVHPFLMQQKQVRVVTLRKHMMNDVKEINGVQIIVAEHVGSTDDV